MFIKRHFTGASTDVSNLWRCRRNVYEAARNLEQDDAPLDMSELMTLQNVMSVNETQAANDNFRGLNVTDDQALEAVRIGIREKHAANIERFTPGRDAARQILDQRITERLRGVAKEEESVIRRNRGNIRGAVLRTGGLFSRKFAAGFGFFGNIRRIFSRETDTAGTGVRANYGQSEQIEDRTRNVADRVMAGLDDIQRMTISNYLTTNRVPLPPPPGSLLERQTVQLCDTDPELMKRMRQNHGFLHSPTRPGPLTPSATQVPPETDLDRLIQLVEIHAEEKGSLVSPTIYNAQRLQGVLTGLRNTNQPVYNLLTTTILKPEELARLEGKPEGLALLGEIERRIQQDEDPDLLEKDLKILIRNLPTVEEKEEEGTDLSPEQRRKKRVAELMKNLKSNHTELAKAYSSGRSIGMQLFNANRRDYEKSEIARTAAATPGNKNIQTGLESIQNDISKLKKLQGDLNEKVRTQEEKYTQDAQNLLRALGVFDTAIPAWIGPGPDPTQEIRDFHALFSDGVAPPATTSMDDLFGNTNYVPPVAPAPPPDYVPPPAQAFENHIAAFTDDHLENMDHGIQAQFTGRFQPARKISARSCLYLLREFEYARGGIDNEDLRLRRSIADACNLIADAKNTTLYMNVNNELAEYLGGTTLGSRTLNRVRKYLRAKLTPSKIFEAQDVFDRITGTVPGMDVFGGMHPDMSYLAMVKYVSDNGIKSEDAQKFLTHLSESVEGFSMANMEGSYELYDIDAPRMEKFLKYFGKIVEVSSSLSAMENLEGKEGTKAHLMLEYQEELEKQLLEADKTVLDKIRDKAAEWKQWFSNNVLKRVFKKKYEDAEKERKKQNMTRGQWDSYKKKNGLAAFAGVFGTALAAKEVADVAVKGAGYAGRGLGFGYRKGLRPVGRGAKYLFYNPAKWGVTTAGKGVVGAAKFAAFPFVAAGSLIGGGGRWIGRKGSNAWNWALRKK